MALFQHNSENIRELITASFTRAGQSISDILAAPVTIQQSQFQLLPLTELEQMISRMAGNQVRTIDQIFSGSLDGIGVIIFDPASIDFFRRHLVDQFQTAAEGEDSENFLQEIGHIILSAFIGNMCNLLNMQVKFSVPLVDLRSLHHMLQSLTIEQSRLQYFLSVEGQLLLPDESSKGTCLVIIGIQSVEVLRSYLPKH